MPRSRSVYLSYAPEDAERAAPILRALKGSRLSCWHEAPGTADGALSPVARRQLEGRAVFIRLCSPSSQASSLIQAEAATFRQLQTAARQQGRPDPRLFVDILLDATYQPTPGERADLTINAAGRPTSAWIAALDQKLGTLHATREVSRRMLTIIVGIVVLLAFLFLIYIAYNGHYIFRNRFPI